MYTRRQAASGLFANLVTLGAIVDIACAQSPKGEFRGRVVTEWIDDGRRMRLLQPLEYLAPDGRRWLVPHNVVVDGASIPQPFWSIVGGPFTGLYRAPSVIHDYFCEVRTRLYTDVHRVFYDGMLTAGVGERRAWLMYQAVLRFGPQWPAPKVPPGCEIVDENYDFNLCAQNTTKPPVHRPEMGKDALREFEQNIEGQADPADLARLREIIEKEPKSVK